MATPLHAGESSDNSVDDNTGLQLTPTISVAGTTVYFVRSCNSVWLFDTKRRRFRRTPKDSAYDLPVPESEWEDYFRVELDESSPRFIVVLNEAGTRLLQSWRHNDPCERCAANEPTVIETDDRTTELSLADIRDAVVHNDARETL